MQNKNLFFWSITVALGGFLFGFDTAVISGGEQSIQELWKLSDAQLGQMVAMALYGTILGALFGGIPADRYGRKVSLFWIGVLYLVSAIGSALAPDVVWLMFFRFIGGLGVGASSVVAPLYISEIAPAKSRGRLVAMFQFNIVFGILMAYASNAMIGTDMPNAWRWMLGVEIIPALFFVVMVPTVPRSPRWLLIQKGDEEAARQVIARINPEHTEEMLQSILEGSHEKRSGLAHFLSGRYNFPILLAFLFALFNQFSGINAIIYYTKRIFTSTGMGDDAALLSSVGIGVVNLIFTLVGLFLIDRFGRKFLMYIGSVAYIVSLSFVAHAFYTEQFVGYSVPIWLFVFIAAHAIGQGAVIWVFISEIFPNNVRAYGNSLGSVTHWIFAALIAGNFPLFEGWFGGGPIFAFFAAMMVFQLIFVWRMMPETMGVSLEDLEAQLLKDEDSSADQ